MELYQRPFLHWLWWSHKFCPQVCLCDKLHLTICKPICIPGINQTGHIIQSSQYIIENKLPEFEDFWVYVHLGNQSVIFCTSLTLLNPYLVLELKQYWFLRMSLGSVFYSVKQLEEGKCWLFFTKLRDFISGPSSPELFCFTRYFAIDSISLFYMDLFELLIASWFNFGRSYVSRKSYTSSRFSQLFYNISFQCSL